MNSDNPFNLDNYNYTSPYSNLIESYFSINMSSFMQNLFLSKRTAIFVDRNIHFSAYNYAGEIRDNTPSRLAVMQHTWGVFSY